MNWNVENEMNFGISEISCFNSLKASIESITFEQSLNRRYFYAIFFFIKAVDELDYLFKYKPSESSV